MSAEPLNLRAFTTRKALELTGLTTRQLQYWDEQAFISPSLNSKRGRGRRRLYSFRDLVSLRVAADLRRNDVSLQTIRAAVEHLHGLDYEHPLSELRFWSEDGRLYFEEAGTYREGRRPDQTVAEYTVRLPAIIDALERGIAVLDRREPGTVERRRGALASKLLIGGTRIPVATVQALAADGADTHTILELYPDLTPADVQAALAQEPQPRRRGRKAA